MSDTFTEVTSQSWFGRLGGAIKGILFGFLFIIIGIVLLFWNEGRAIHTHKALVESQGQVIAIDAFEYQSSYEGRLVHLSGEATTNETLTDGAFNVSVPALKLKRTVETFQWQEEEHSETKKKLGGGSETVTTYTYSQGWHNGLINSSQFKQAEGHQNPRNAAYQTQGWTAGDIHIGEYTLGRELKGDIQNFQRFSINSPAANLQNVKHFGDQYYIGSSPTSPAIGDQRISYHYIPPQDYSVAARLTGQVLTPHTTSNGETVALLAPGRLSADSMFEQAKADNAQLTWILRLVGTLVLVIGFGMLMKPISVVADVLPLAGDLVEMGTGIIALVLGISVALLTISIAWIAYRPLLGGALLIGVCGLIWFFKQQRSKAHERVIAKAPPVPQHNPGTANAPPPAPPV